MMALNSKDLNIEEIRSSIENQIRHPYLAKFIPNPVISEDKLMFLATLMKQSELPEDKQKQYIITTMLVQIALDTHELVTTTGAHETAEVQKQRQLTVLAGDYYSGLYYYLLSKLEDLPMIQTLASTIKEINELKMNIYNQDFPTLSQVMDGLMKVESLLIQRVAEFVQKPVMNDVAGDWLLAMRLQSENKRYHKRETAPILELLMRSPFVQVNGIHAIRTMDKLIRKHMLRVEQSISHLPQNFEILKDYLQQHIYQSFYIKQRAMEEG
ncbi:heptaprenyl diphosphate synthase [Pontibacillus yanchengensis]|uniref:Heptaprenyl diphosphate synthase n=3 Tax=Pontibacillus yanchengensis TaxID=462910 RepID=A0ACC7VK21_9BACI|nr:heptaprenyl diphosphate synthase [Pontibacillus yanchengensis]MYL55137.1 heptaprenyl diphosphate synthase [Pontibacillus yanchengensis]